MYPAVEVGTTTTLAAVEQETAPASSSPTSCPVEGSTKHVKSEAAVVEALKEDG
jgi:hypothetical protein